MEFTRSVLNWSEFNPNAHKQSLVWCPSESSLYDWQVTKGTGSNRKHIRRPVAVLKTGCCFFSTVTWEYNHVDWDRQFNHVHTYAVVVRFVSRCRSRPWIAYAFSSGLAQAGWSKTAIICEQYTIEPPIIKHLISALRSIFVVRFGLPVNLSKMTLEIDATFYIPQIPLCHGFIGRHGSTCIRMLKVSEVKIYLCNHTTAKVNAACETSWGARVIGRNYLDAFSNSSARNFTRLIIRLELIWVDVEFQDHGFWLPISS